MIAISADSPSEQAGLRERFGLTFPMLWEGARQIAASYGVRQEGGSWALPATFVVEADGTISFVHVGADAVDRPSIEDLLRALRR